MNVNTSIEIDGADAVDVEPGGTRGADDVGARAVAVGLPADLDPTAALELMRELEQRLRVASMRIAIEGEDLNADVLEALERLTAFVEESLG
jgi:hypothetical protein